MTEPGTDVTDSFGPDVPFEDSIREVLPTKLREFNCNYGGSHDHGHTACLFFVLAANEIDRLRELLADYGRHSEGCSGEFGPTYRCRCGWREVEQT